MKKHLILISGLLAAGNGQAQTDFVDGSWKEAFATAQKQHKNLFVDCYTDWCGWCKVADKKTFPDQRVADFLNQHFVSVQVDMETDAGLVLGAKYRVMGYPSYLMFAPDGSLMGKLSGYMQDPAEFVKAIEEVMNNGSLAAYPSKLFDDAGLPEFYTASFKNKDREKKAERPDVSVVSAWLLQQPELTSEAAWSVMYKFELSDALEQKFLGMRPELARLYGQDEVNQKLSSIANVKLRKAMKSKDEADLKLVQQFADQYLDDKGQKKAYYELKFCEGKEDWKGYVRCAQGLVDLNGLENHLDGINNYSWTLYLKATDQEVLNTAIGWMEKVVELSPLYMYVDTYAAVLYKGGRYDKALTWVDKAISVGTENGEDVSGTQKLKEQIITAKEGGKF